MAAANTDLSDIDRVNASIEKLAFHLNNYRQACETPSLDPSLYERLQQVRLGAIDKDLENIRKDLDSARARLLSSASSSEEDAAKDAVDRKNKQAVLDRAVQAAEKREEDAKKREERLDRAIMYVREKDAEADKKMAEAVRKDVEAGKKMAEAEKMMIAAQRESDAAVAEQSKADSELAGMRSMRASFEADFQQRSKRLQQEEKRIMERVASISSSEGRLAANQQSHKKFELMTRERMEEANAVMQCAQEEREAAQRNLDTAVAIDRITSGAGDSVNSNSMNEMLKQADQSIQGSIDRLSLAATDVSRELAEVSVGIGELKIATQAAKTLTSDVGLLQRATRKLITDIDSTGKRPLSSQVEPTGKRTKPTGPVDSIEEADTDPIVNVSSGRVIRPTRSRRSTSATSGPSGQTPEPSGPSNRLSLLHGPAASHGLFPGVGLCPAGMRRADDETRRVWKMADSTRLLDEFNKHAAKSAVRQLPQAYLDWYADATGKSPPCLLQKISKLSSNWNQGEDKATTPCRECTKKGQPCIRVSWVSDSHGEYDKNATNAKRWNVTKRQ